MNRFFKNIAIISLTALTATSANSFSNKENIYHGNGNIKLWINGCFNQTGYLWLHVESKDFILPEPSKENPLPLICINKNNGDMFTADPVRKIYHNVSVFMYLKPFNEYSKCQSGEYMCVLTPEVTKDTVVIHDKF